MKRFLKRVLGRQVLAGPFAGMRYIGYSSGSTLMPKILGTYEMELHPLLAALGPRLNRTVVIVGAAEGYYAAGWLKLRAGLKVVAFEMSEEGRMALAELAQLNSVSDRLLIKGACDPDGLRQVLGNSSVDLLFVDVEGYERILLDPASVPGLSDTPMLVELHDSPGTVMREILSKRFSATHRIEHVPCRPRVPEDIGIGMFRALAKVSSRARHSLLWERGDDAGWLYLEPYTGTQGRA